MHLQVKVLVKYKCQIRLLQLKTNAFYDCENLTKVYIPESVTEIKGNPFSKCINLSSIKVADNNEKYDSRNNCNAIIETAINELKAGCENTEIPESVIGIGDNAFYGCSYMSEINLPDNVNYIGKSSFYGNGIEMLAIPDGLTDIGDNAFYNCEDLNSIDISESVTNIGENVFGNCRRLEKIIVSTDNTKYDSRKHCNAIIETATNELKVGCKKTEIPATVASIGDNAFYGNLCKTIYYNDSCNYTAEISENVTSIGDKAFYNCTGLDEIDFKWGSNKNR